LKRETEVQVDKVDHIEARLSEMELQIGMIANTKTYQANFDLGDEVVDLKQLADTFRPSIKVENNEIVAVEKSVEASRTDKARLNVNSSHGLIRTSIEQQ
jgi:hypothetical protein